MRDNEFHKHLDVCSQCANGPFDLCPRGQALLEAEATGLGDYGAVEFTRLARAERQKASPK